MLTKRLIICLDVLDKKVTKGVKFKGNIDIGDPVEMGARYSAEGVDELVFYDITASAEGRALFTDILREVGENFKYVVTLEDGTVKGGLGSAVAEYMANNAYSPKIKILGIPDAFVEHGTPEQLYEKCGMDKKSVLSAILEFNGVAGQ